VGNVFAKARHEGIELILDTSRDTVLNHSDILDVFLPVLLRSRNICAARFELDGDEFAKAVFNSGERFIDDISNIVVPGGANKVIPRCNSASTLSKLERVVILLRREAARGEGGILEGGSWK